LWACSPYFFSIAQSKIGVNQLNVDRLLAATIILGLIICFRFIFISEFPIDISWKQILLLVLSGAVGLMFGDYFLFTSYRKIGPRYSMLMMSIAPAFSVIGSNIFFGEKLGIAELIGIVTIIIGIAIVVSKKNKSDNKNEANSDENNSIKNIKPHLLLFGLLAALGQSGALLCVKKAFQFGNIDSMIATFIRVSSAGIMMMCWLSIFKKYTPPIRLYKNNPSAFKYVLLGTIIGPVFGITSSIISLNYVSVSIAQTLFSTSPIFMLPISHFFFDDKITLSSVIGAIIVVIGVGLLFLH
jgi:drug/metabolite transporter (DMT)-like permease